MLKALKTLARIVIAQQAVEQECPMDFAKLMYAVAGDQEFAKFAEAVAAEDAARLGGANSEALMALHDLCKAFYGSTGTRLQLGFDEVEGPFFFLPNAIYTAPEVGALVEKHGKNIAPFARKAKIVRRANGRYVKDWQYSQGHFDVAETGDPMDACTVTDHCFKTFFEPDGDKHLTRRVVIDLAE